MRGQVDITGSPVSLIPLTAVRSGWSCCCCFNERFDHMVPQSQSHPILLCCGTGRATCSVERGRSASRPTPRVYDGGGEITHWRSFVKAFLQLQQNMFPSGLRRVTLIPACPFSPPPPPLFSSPFLVSVFFVMLSFHSPPTHCCSLKLSRAEQLIVFVLVLVSNTA